MFLHLNLADETVFLLCSSILWGIWSGPGRAGLQLPDGVWASMGGTEREWVQRGPLVMGAGGPDGGLLTAAPLCDVGFLTVQTE